jgi:hypothetical protein
MSGAPVPKLIKKPQYKGVRELVGKSPGRAEWTDAEIIGLKSIELTKLSDADMLTEVQYFLHGMTVKMTPRAIASALLLTWNMRTLDPVEARLFPENDEGKDAADLKVARFEITGETYTSTAITTLVGSTDPFAARRAGAFMAASTLKMFAKSSNGWRLAWDNNHIQSRFEGFTKTPFPFKDIKIEEKSITTLYDAYQGQKIYLGTLGRILYQVSMLEDQRQTEMLFDQHLSCTGLHIIPQFINARLNIGASTEDLLSALDMGQNTQTLEQLMGLINGSLSLPPSEDNRGTWRFARLFDPTAFGLLQTKFCRDTVAVLAHINHISTASTDLSNPLNIAVLRFMGPERLRISKLVAKNIHHYFTVTARAANNEFYNVDKFKGDESEEENEDSEDEEPSAEK